ITSCGGSYSKDGFLTQYDFDLTPSKVHEYTYTGTIPAETEEVLDGEVIFRIGDAAGNDLVTDSYQVRWRDGQIEFEEDFESGTDGWDLGGRWAIVEEGEYTSASWALTESPGGNYNANESSIATLATDMDWSTYMGANMSFWCTYDIEMGFDYMYFEVTTDGGATWIELKKWDGEGVAWHEERIALDAFVGSSQFNMRFRFDSDQGLEKNGMYIDDIYMVTYNTDVAPPLPVHAHYYPEFYEGALDEYTNFVDALDISGVAGVEVVWSVDGVPQPNVVATFVSGVQWEFTIPAQPGGSVIEYQFWSEDASINSNSATNEDVYTVIAGEHMVYDANIVSFYNTLENGNAMAVKITVPGSDATTTFGADLGYLLYNMYADSENQSDPMTVRVWQDDGTGQPGTEI
ncbi:MAG: immune inhibitor A, partial [Candidatus Delongbacteria bacterium]|nr:immune inhibitor A [Candidatus Delongbacteria bacterium]